MEVGDMRTRKRCVDFAMTREKMLCFYHEPHDDWLQLAEHFGKQYHQAVGTLAELNAFAAHTGKQWIGGHRQQSQIFH